MSPANKPEYYRKRRETIGQFSVPVAREKLDAISADKQLRAAFELVLKEWQARSIVIEGQKEIILQDQFELED